MKNLSFLIVFMIAGCVPYQQQVYKQQERTLDELLATSKRGETIANKVLYQNQLDFENHNIDCGGEITLQRILPKYEQFGPFDIIITNNTLLIPVAGYLTNIAYSKYYLVWDGKLKIDEANHANVDLIFIQSEPVTPVYRTRIHGGEPYSHTADGTPVTRRNIQYPTVRYVSFDLTKLRDAYSNSVTLNLLGLDMPMEYTYP